MANYPSTADQSSTQPSTASTGKKSNTKIYIAIIVVLVAVIGVLVLLGSGGLGTTTIGQPTSNATPIYLAPSQAETLLGSQIINVSYNYSTSSIYNASSPINVTILEEIVPQLSGNLTNGWVTFAQDSGITNASLQYIVMQTSDGSNITAAFAEVQAESFSPLPSIVNGFTDGMNYTYEAFSNSTGSFQTIIGWKDGYVTVIDLSSATGYTTNQTVMAQIAAGNIQ